MYSRKLLILISLLGFLLLTFRAVLDRVVIGLQHGLQSFMLDIFVPSVTTERFSTDHTQGSLLKRIFPPNISIKPNPYIAPLLSCRHHLNEQTQHVRIPSASLRIIHMNPPNTPSSGASYFNPAILRLPASSKYDYIVFSRLVTPGLHQETHYCPAFVNAATHDIQCSETPKYLNIPPTSAYRCTGRWASFADIPGFHDPRVFWSGKGEPLVIVNSASAARPNGCVGLWVVDLRAVIDELDHWIQSDQQDGIEDPKESGTASQDQSDTLLWRAKMSYPYLTEITKNPRSSRYPIEKNWVLFFPKDEETWVMYDMLRYEKRERQSMDIITQNELITTSWEVTNHSVLENGTGSKHSDMLQQQRNANLTFNLGGSLDKSIASHERATPDTKLVGIPLDEQHKEGHLQGKRAFSGHFASDRVGLRPSRSFAKLIGSGFTTTNLTSPNESPCFNDSHTYDNLNDTGYWHQGSNSLRLVLCQREEYAKDPPSQAGECLLTPENEAELVDQGRVVHFMVMHRKFSNELDLPMRYERYFLVWEARWPFRVLGVTSYPVLFAGERAEPWSEQANWPIEEVVAANETERRGEREKWTDTYFSYTPGLSWAKRSRHMQNAQPEHVHELGTGYMGDSVVVGIGMDDLHQGFVKVKVEDLLCCLRLCLDFEQAQ